MYDHGDDKEVVMTSEVETRTGRCATHGAVRATRKMPALRYPIILDVAVRAVARHRRYDCPTCGAPVTV
jgi:hypothetical protein